MNKIQQVKKQVFDDIDKWSTYNFVNGMKMLQIINTKYEEIKGKHIGKQIKVGKENVLL
jgi:hypothetical protein